MRKKLIHTLPEQLDSNLLYQLEERGAKQWKIVDPVGIDLTKTIKESNPAETEEDIDLFEQEEHLLEEWDPDAIEEEESQSETGTK